MGPRLSYLGLVIPLAVAFYPGPLHAQCSEDSDPDSLACQIQEPGGSSSQSQEAPAVFDVSGPVQRQPRADQSSEASAVGSLTSGSTYTERSSQPGPAAEPRSLGLSPEPPTEFQRFVAATTGQMLPIYGIGLFTGRQVTFAPVSNAPAPVDLILSAQD